MSRMCKKSRSKTKSKGLEKFLKECKNIYGDYYDLSKVNYVNNYTILKLFVLFMGLSLNIHEVLLRGEKVVMNVI